MTRHFFTTIFLDMGPREFACPFLKGEQDEPHTESSQRGLSLSHPGMGK